MVTKLGRIVTYFEGRLSHMTLWSYDLVRSQDNLKPLYPDYHSFWPPNLGGLWLTLSGSHPENYTTLWSHGLERLRDKLKLLNRHYQCLWPGSLTGSWSSLKDYYPYGHMTLKSRGFARSRDKLKTNVTIIPTAAKIGTVVTYSKELQLIKFYDSSITSFCETTWQLECFISPPALEQWLPNMTRWWLTVRV